MDDEWTIYVGDHHKRALEISGEWEEFKRLASSLYGARVEIFSTEWPAPKEHPHG